MELLYVWLERASIIEKVPLTFSGKFQFNVAQDDRNRRIDVIVSLREGYIDNLYGPNICELTAIVGANGAGKTTLLETLIRILGNNLFVGEKFIACFYDRSKNIIHTVHDFFEIGKGKLLKEWDVRVDKNTDSFEIANPVKVNVSFDRNNYVNNYSIPFLKNIRLIYYSPAFDLRDYPDGIKNAKQYIDVSTNYLVFQDSVDKNDTEDLDQIERHRLKNTKRQFELTQDKRFDLSDLQLPTIIQVRYNKSRPFERELSISNRSLYKALNDSGTKAFGKVNSNIRAASKKGRDTEKSAVLEKIKLWFVINLIANYFSNLAIVGDQSYELEYDYSGIEKKDYITAARQFLAEQEWIDKSQFEFNSFIEFVFNKIDSGINRRESISEDTSFFYIDVSEALEVYQWDLKLVTAYNKSIQRTDRRGYSFLDLNWRDMSTGEKAYLDIFSRIFYAYRQAVSSISEYYFDEDNAESFFYGETNINCFYLLLDEPELGFHPKWQRRFIARITNYLNLLTESKIQLILTSHSPFVVSDIPRERIIFVTREKNKTLNIGSLESHEQTFAANIHDLFADAFFMGEGLVGDFALTFINTILADIEEAQHSGITSDRSVLLLNRIKLIGEPLIQSRLEDLFDDLTITDNTNQPDDIDQQIADAEKKLEDLRKKKNPNKNV
ncbi:AAA family ATPase [Fulvivirgaceae bacterium PWU4]|uniref:AAA family ATPase n=1 Tax=Chryseosolibacter histidini TaxID=2782349 RepID=A0AAP2DNN2_9BACT|nr:AAA family ATPase [Chryseosolibacter histidini]MBT1699626.1 AAA family ATPase [Chryseosolibacter histidini]